MKTKRNKFNKFLNIILFLASIILFISIYLINILDIKYLLVILCILIIINLICFILRHKKKKKTGYFLTIIFTIFMSLISFYILKTNNIIESFNQSYKTYNYKVLVLKDSKYNGISDIKDTNLGYYKTDSEETSKSLSKLSQKVKTNNIDYDNTNSLAKDLINGQIDAILIEDSYLNIITEKDETSTSSENDIMESFNDQTKVIYSFTIRIKINDISKDVDVTKKTFNVYISGIDTYGEVSSVSRSDVNMIITVNPNTHQILLTSIPRDYYVKLHGVSGYKDKLTHAGLYGVDMSVNTLEDLLDIDINYYVKVNFTSIIDIVDAVGGVEVYSDYTFTSQDGYNYKKGYNKVNGKEALSFVRERKAFIAGDRQRIKDQQALIDALFRKCTSKDIITKYNSLLNSIEGKFITNMSTDRLKSLIRIQLSKNYSWTITSNSLDGANSSNYTYSMPNTKAYVMEPYEESITNAKNLINSVIDGKQLESSYNQNSSDVNSVTKNNTNSNNSNNNSSNNNSNQNTNPVPQETTPKTTGLKASLNKTSITFVSGDDYIYNGFTATYNDVDITSKASYKFNVNGATFTDSSELISYVSSLSPGNYTINYNISYKDETIILKQSVTIESLPDTNNNNSNDQEDNNDYTIKDDLQKEDPNTLNPNY